MNRLLLILFLLPTLAFADDWGPWNDPNATPNQLWGPDPYPAPSSFAESNLGEYDPEIGPQESALLDIGGVIGDLVQQILDQGYTLEQALDGIGALGDVGNIVDLPVDDIPLPPLP